MSPLLFWLFSALLLGFAAGVVLNRNPVGSALSLVISFLGLAALFVLLDAHFLGIIQVLVYAGAVMVLFLFIIMLLDLKAEQRRRFRVVASVGGGLVAVALAGQIVVLLGRYDAGRQPFPPLSGPVDDVRAIGFMLFSNYTLPFQIVGGLLLVAILGVILLSKRELK
jgi:NADH-quinone oxidoreductase subunit J